jgi:heme exporter protein A
LWLLDEPLTALDDEGCALVRSLLDEHRRRGGGAICATHPPLGIADARCQRLGSPA